jgi:monovalent cation:H+ antiporter, CPA1 family
MTIIGHAITGMMTLIPERSGESFATLEYAIPIFLLMIFAAAVISSRTKFPHTIVLVLLGIGISIFMASQFNPVSIKEFNLNPRLVIDFIVPPLLFEAMMRVNYSELKTVRLSAILLATVGVVLATLVTGTLLAYLEGLPFVVAFIFAALIAPTDPSVVIDMFRRLKVPKQLSALMQFEASFNDATGLIIFSSVVTLLLATGSPILSGSQTQIITTLFPNVNLSNHPFSVLSELEIFAIVFLGGGAIGLAVSAGTHRLHALMNDRLSETALTVATVFGSVAAANALGLSGLVAAAVAGLYFGNVTVKQEAHLSTEVREAVFDFWELAAFFATSAAFVYLGLSMNIFNIANNILIILLVFAAVIVSRIVSTYPILAVINKFTKEKIPLVWRHIVMLGGMRGALSVALVASLPESAYKNTIATITFGVVLASLSIQYIALTRYVRKVFPERI